MAASKELTSLPTTYIKLPRPDASENRAIPAAPTNIVQNPAYANNVPNVTSITITWDDSASTVNHYDLYLDSEFAATASVGDETHTFSGLVAGSNHTAHIEAVNALGIKSDRWILPVRVSQNI